MPFITPTDTAIAEKSEKAGCELVAVVAVVAEVAVLAEEAVVAFIMVKS
jgi:hypothetical protein